MDGSIEINVDFCFVSICLEEKPLFRGNNNYEASQMWGKEVCVVYTWNRHKLLLERAFKPYHRYIAYKRNDSELEFWYRSLIVFIFRSCLRMYKYQLRFDVRYKLKCYFVSHCHISSCQKYNIKCYVYKGFYFTLLITILC